MARCFVHLLKTAAHGANTYGKPKRVSIRESIGWQISRAGGEQAPACRAILEFDAHVDVAFDIMVTPQAKSTAKASITATAADNEGTVMTFTVANMKVGEAQIELQNGASEQVAGHDYEGTSLDPISVSG